MDRREGLRELVAVAIQRADAQAIPDGYADGVTGMARLNHREVSDWSAFIADAIIPMVLEEAALYLDGYAGGHYMAQSCAAVLREIAKPNPPETGAD